MAVIWSEVASTPEGRLLEQRVANDTYDKQRAQQGDRDYQAAVLTKELGDRVTDALLPR